MSPAERRVREAIDVVRDRGDGFAAAVACASLDTAEGYRHAFVEAADVVDRELGALDHEHEQELRRAARSRAPRALAVAVLETAERRSALTRAYDDVLDAALAAVRCASVCRLLSSADRPRPAC